MPLPASLFLQRGRSDSMMNVLDEHGNATAPSPTTGIHIMQDPQNGTCSSRNTLSADDETVSLPLYTPPITMTASYSCYGPHGLLACAMSSSYGAPHTQATSTSRQFNPRGNLLRRTSSSSTLDSSEDEEEVAWSPYDIERLTAIYEACVEEASFETPFSGPPPSQLLHAIAKACKRTYKEDWPHSITQTRLKANQIAREKERLENGDWATGFGSRRPSVEATPKPPGYVENDTEATPRRKMRRNGSMDFLPEKWDLDAVARLSDKLNKTGEDDPHLYHYPYRLRTDTCSFGSDNQGAPSRSVPSSPTRQEGNESGADSFDKHVQHPLAQSDPCLEMLSSSRRPSLKPGFGMFPTSSPRAHHGTNTLYHAPSHASFYSDAPSSICSDASLSSSMDTVALSFSNNDSIYGSSFASTASDFSSLNGEKKRQHQLYGVSDGMEENSNWKQDGPFSLSTASGNIMASTPPIQSAITNVHGTVDYSSAFAGKPIDFHSDIESNEISTSINTTMNNKRPHPGNINATVKPPLQKSYAFDAISTSPTKKYMRMDDAWSSSSPFSSNAGLTYPYANGIGYSGGGNAGMMLESPFEMDIGDNNQKSR